ncbi:MAG: histidine phosphatase family protein [Chloroflexi bacterium]|nr:MAG: histidine phosphatase family protein [Chloroflexota bacterium]
MHLLLIRHGQSYVNLADWSDGNADVGLTELGQKQAQALAEWIVTKVTAVDALYASNMRRAQETAAPLAKAYNIAITFDNRLRELGNNRWDHTPWPSHNLPNYGDYWASERPFAPITPEREDGETYMHFRVRVGQFIEEMVEKHRGQTILAVCHGGVIEAAYDHIFNIGPWRRCEILTKNTGITHFEYVEHPRREIWRLRHHNRVEHLAKITQPTAD